MKKKILMLFCGWTIAMDPDPKTGALRPAKWAEDLLVLVPKIKELVDLDVIELFDIDSTDVWIKQWRLIADTIYENYEKYEWFVITHGTDTMVDTSSAISLIFGKNLSKPIVFTWSQTHSWAIGTDAKLNLENVFRTVTYNIPEVMISFGNFVLRAIRSQKRHDSDYNAFHSPNYPELAFLRSEINWNLPVLKNKNLSQSPINFQKDFINGVINIKVNAWLKPEQIIKLIYDDWLRWIVFESLWTWNIPSWYIESIKSATSKNIPVLIASPFAWWTTHATTYELWYEALKAWAIETRDMTSTSIYVKLMWCLAQIDKKIELWVLTKQDLISTLREMFNTDYVGEVSI